MPDTVEQQAIAAFKARLDTIAGATIYKNRSKPVPDASLPAIEMVVVGSEGAEFGATGVEAHGLNILVACYAKKTAARSASEVNGDLRGAVRQAIGADPTLGNLIVDINETDTDIDINEIDGAPESGGSLIAFSVLYWTRPGDPYSVGP
jgi:hypothetical protein